jgi:hypothetical protein
MAARRGRPPSETVSVPVLVRVEVDLLEQIDELRRAAPDLPSRPEAIRRLVLKALAAGKDATA